MTLEELEDAEGAEYIKIEQARHELKVLEYRCLQSLAGYNFYKAKYLSFRYTNNVEAVGLMSYCGIHRKDVTEHNYTRGGFYFVMNEQFPSLYQAFGSTLIDNPIDYSTVKPITKDQYDLFIKNTNPFKRFK